eukprot:14205906-Heterocapsa_arctica.AAC.1
MVNIIRPCSGAQTPVGTAALKKLAGRLHPKPLYTLIVCPAGKLLEDGCSRRGCYVQVPDSHCSPQSQGECKAQGLITQKRSNRPLKCPPAYYYYYY